MPDFTVIDGGGKPKSPPDPAAEKAKEELAAVFVEMLRAIGRGDDNQRRLAKRLVAFSESVIEARQTLPEIVDAVIPMQRERLFPINEDDEAEFYRTRIVLAALRVAMEMCANDEGASVHLSGRKHDLDRAIYDREESINRRLRARAKPSRAPKGKPKV